jgi:hypothetical protein
MKIFVNFADEKFRKQQKFALSAAKFFGNFDKIIGYTPQDLDEEFLRKNERVMSTPRGAGLWLWKPYLILKTLEEANDGDFVFYLDSGLFMTKKIDLLIGSLEKSDQDIMPFQTYYPEKQWTKKSLFEKMECDEEKYFESNQLMSTICLIRNSQFSRKFFSDFLFHASDYDSICDAEKNEIQADVFIEHRHDQSIYSLLCKKDNLVPFRAPFVFAELGAAYAVMKKISLVYGRDLLFNFVEFENSSYPTMIQTSKSFNFLGLSIDLFFISYIYLKILNVIPFKSRAYNALLNAGTRGL